MKKSTLKKGLAVVGATLIAAGGAWLAGCNPEEGKEENVGNNNSVAAMQLKINGTLLSSFKNSEIVQSETDAVFKKVDFLGARSEGRNVEVFGSAVYQYGKDTTNKEGLISATYAVGEGVLERLYNEYYLSDKMEVLEEALREGEIVECNFTPTNGLEELNGTIEKTKPETLNDKQFVDGHVISIENIKWNRMYDYITFDMQTQVQYGDEFYLFNENVAVRPSGSDVITYANNSSLLLGLYAEYLDSEPENVYTESNSEPVKLEINGSSNFLGMGDYLGK